MKRSGSFDVQTFGIHFRFTAECGDAYTALDQYAFPWLPRVDAKTGTPDLDLRIEQAAGEFRLAVGGNAVASASEAKALVCSLIQVLDETVVQRIKTLRAVHAGVVMLDGRVLLFPGSTHAGKSALVAELLRRGATYFSDEYALIDAEGLIHPYPRPLLVRDGNPMQTPLLAEDCNAPVATAPAPLGWIFALRYQPEDGWNVAAASQSEALMILLKNTPHVLADSPEMIGIFQRAVTAAECFGGTRGEAAEAADKIVEMIGNR